MAATAKKTKVDRNEVYNKIVQMITASPAKEAEISSTDLASVFDVSAPTMDHHLKVLVRDGMIRATNRRGSYNRKIYVLPDGAPSILSTDIGPSSASRQWLEQRRRQVQEKQSSVTDIDTKRKPADEPAPVAENPTVPEEPKAETPVHAPVQEEVRVEAPELSLDRQIQDFMARSQSIPDAEAVLQKNDRDILAVVNESIQQNMIYLKDLMDQLSTVTDKKLILGLVEERNQLLEKTRNLEDEAKEHVALIGSMQKKQVHDEAKIEANRVKMMYQLIINTIDSFVDQPNHSMALQRKDFRNKITKEVSDLVKYVLGVEK
jgi:DNA-binding transcriptional ArsR family regulator